MKQELNQYFPFPTAFIKGQFNPARRESASHVEEVLMAAECKPLQQYQNMPLCRSVSAPINQQPPPLVSTYYQNQAYASSDPYSTPLMSPETPLPDISRVKLEPNDEFGYQPAGFQSHMSPYYQPIATPPYKFNMYGPGSSPTSDSSSRSSSVESGPAGDCFNLNGQIIPREFFPPGFESKVFWPQSVVNPKPQTRISRRNNPDLDKRRVHFCEYESKSFFLFFY